MTDGLHDGTLETLRSALAGQYAIDRLLGVGAMGTVYLGRDVTLERAVAIKVINPDLAATRTFRERFLLEARTVANLRHPSIVAVYAAGEAGGYLYFVMELVGGESLRDLLDRTTRCDADRAAAILGDMADALAYAHAQGVVHRDVKPENVLLDASSGRAMLTDFGVARAFSDDSRARLTGTGLAVGSPRYMSPEQAVGERELDGRSDIYSLGLVGYEMLVGETPFATTTATAVLAKRLTERAPPVATRAPQVPSNLALAIDRALETEPDERWPDAAAMARAIRGDVPASPPPSAARASGSAPSRRRWPLGVAAAAVAVAAAAWGIVSRASASDSGDAYLVLPFGILRGDQSLDWLRQGSVDMLTRNLAQWRDVAAVDYERTLDLLRQAELKDDQTIGLTEARQLARRARAGTVVLGHIQRNGDSLSVVARVYDVDDGTMKQEIPVSALASRDARWLFDRLANELLGLAGAPPQRKVEVARTTTASVEAYRHYLRGAHALHTFNLEAADSAFERATAIDTTFALAYYKRALTQGLRSAADTVVRHSVRLAAAHSARLPARERALVEALLDLEEANHERARQRYAGLLTQDSTDAEAWYGYGEAYFHGNAKGPDDDRATRWTKALHAFKRAISYDSSFHLAYAHAVDIYRYAAQPTFAWIIENDTLRPLAPDAAQNRVASARERSQGLAIETGLRWLDADPAAGMAYAGLADAFASARRYNDAISTLQRAMRQPASRHADYPYRVAAFQLPAQPAQALATLRDAMHTYGAESLAVRGSGWRLWTVLTSANVAMSTGALGDMDRLLAIAERVEPMMPIGREGGGARPTALATTRIRITVRAASGVATAGDRRSIDSAIAAVEALPAPASSRVNRELVTIPYAGFRTTGDQKYVEVIQRWTGREPTPTVQALVALRSGDTTQARRLAARFPTPGAARLGASPDDFDDPLTRAEVLAAIGERGLALATLETIEPTSFEVLTVDLRWAMYGRSLLVRGMLYEQEGKRELALKAYERYLSLMRDADATFQPQLQAARARVNALRDAPGVTLTPR